MRDLLLIGNICHAVLLMRCIIFLLRLTYYTSCQNCVYTVQQGEEGKCPHGQLTAQRETAVQQRLEERGCMENDYSKMACASHPFVTMDTLYVCDNTTSCFAV